MELAVRLSDGRTELCGNPIATGETNQTWTTKAGGGKIALTGRAGVGQFAV